LFGFWPKTQEAYTFTPKLLKNRRLVAPNGIPEKCYESIFHLSQKREEKKQKKNRKKTEKKEKEEEYPKNTTH